MPYRQKIVTLCFQLNAKNFAVVKTHLIKFIKNFEVDDILYIKNQKTDKKGEIVSLLRHTTDSFHDQVVDCLDFLDGHNFFCDKYLYVFNDSLYLQDYAKERFFKLCAKHDCIPVIFETAGNLTDTKIDSFNDLKL